ncbi:MAG: phage holin family protein [Ruminococcus sp.]|nr:phage holin family protein [Ruminococcus sp.]
MDKVIKTVSGLLGAIAGYLWGPLDGLLLALITMMCLDYVTGIIVGAVQHKLNSQVGFKGLAKKSFILIIVAVCHTIDTQIFSGSQSVLRSGACLLYIANEGLSILENGGELGFPYPKKLKAVLEQLRDKDKEESEK